MHTETHGDALRQKQTRIQFIIDVLSRSFTALFLALHANPFAMCIYRCLGLIYFALCRFNFNWRNVFAGAPLKCCMLLWFHCVNWIVETATPIQMKHFSCVHSVCCVDNFHRLRCVSSWASFSIRNSNKSSMMVSLEIKLVVWALEMSHRFRCAKLSSGRQWSGHVPCTRAWKASTLEVLNHLRIQ